jgi:hypothetical protein
MIFSFYDFGKVAWLQNPLKVSSKSPAVFAIDPSSQKLGLSDMLEKVTPPTENIATVNLC